VPGDKESRCDKWTSRLANIAFGAPATLPPPSLVLVKVLAVGIVRADIPFLVLSATSVVVIAHLLVVNGVAAWTLPASFLPPQ